MINSDLQEILKIIYEDDLIPLTENPNFSITREFIENGPKEGDPCVQKLTIFPSKTTIIFKGLGYYNEREKYKRQLIKIE